MMLFVCFRVSKVITLGKGAFTEYYIIEGTTVRWRLGRCEVRSADERCVSVIEGGSLDCSGRDKHQECHHTTLGHGNETEAITRFVL